MDTKGPGSGEVWVRPWVAIFLLFNRKLSITGKKIFNCLKNDSDLLRKENLQRRNMEREFASNILTAPLSKITTVFARLSRQLRYLSIDSRSP